MIFWSAEKILGTREGVYSAHFSTTFQWNTFTYWHRKLIIGLFRRVGHIEVNPHECWRTFFYVCRFSICNAKRANSNIMKWQSIKHTIMTLAGEEQCRVPKPLHYHDFVPFQILVFCAAGRNFVFCLSKLEYYSGLLRINVRAF